MATTTIPLTHTEASVLQVNDTLHHHQPYEQLPTHHTSRTCRRPCLIIPNTATSLHPNDNNNSDDLDDKSSNRILLRGPKQSGKSSIAMNLACTVASDTSCFCQQKLTPQSPCRCVAVTFFRPMKQNEFSPSFVDESTSNNNNSNHNDSGFPLPCQQLQDDNNSEETMPYRTSSPMALSSEHDWDMNSLSRIQVHHVNSIREILHYLLSIKGKPIQEQPSGAIIIDDLDILASKETNPSMAMLQTMALLVDTSNVLASSHDGSTPIILATTENKFNVPWMPTTVRLLHQAAEHSWRKLLCDDLNVVSSWKAVGHKSFMSKTRHVFTSQYFLTKRSGDGRFQIHWK